MTKHKEVGKVEKEIEDCLMCGCLQTMLGICENADYEGASKYIASALSKTSGVGDILNKIEITKDGAGWHKLDEYAIRFNGVEYGGQEGRNKLLSALSKTSGVGKEPIICDAKNIGRRRRAWTSVEIKEQKQSISLPNKSNEEIVEREIISIVRGWCIRHDALVCSENTEERFEKLTSQLGKAITENFAIPNVVLPKGEK